MLSKLFALFLSIYYMITPYVAPSTAEPIKVLDEQSVELTFVAWGDSQISNYMFDREPRLRAAAEDLANASSNLDALLVVGDIAENGLECEYEVVSDHFKTADIDNYLMVVGNHDIRLRSYKQVVNRFTSFQNELNKNAGSELAVDKLNYSYEINGYTFIVLGNDKTVFEENYFSEEQLTWLDETLKAKAVDATGAGDSFFGGFLYKLTEIDKTPNKLSLNEACDFAKFGNAVASLCVEGYGAIPSLPTMDAVLNRIKNKA